MKLDSLEAVIEDVRAGKPIVLVDDTDRENEGDLMIAAEKATAETINFMMLHGKGLVCLSLSEERRRVLGVPLQVIENSSTFGTNFAVSIDHSSVIDRGVTAGGRALTIRQSVSEQAKPEDFMMPGFVFPVCAVPGGVLKRRGQTEGSVDLARLSGLKPAGVICEVMGEHGLMIRGAELQAYCRRFGLKICSIEQIYQHRLHHEVSIRRISEFSVAQGSGLDRGVCLSKVCKTHSNISFRAVGYVDDVEGKEHLAFVKGNPRNGCLVRIHSECLTGDVFESRRCDCGRQFDQALAAILEEGEGVIVYLHQEGRGIGLGNKVSAYELQDQGFDTVDANIELGFEADLRDYRVGAQILNDLGLSRIRLMTNNPKKLSSLLEFGLEEVERVSMSVEIDEYNTGYLTAKRDRMGHVFP